MKTDAMILKNVMAELMREPLLKGSEIEVAVKDKIVTLSGAVDSYAKRDAAEEAASNASGVKAVEEGIVVRLSEKGRKIDKEISQVLADALCWPVRSENIQ
jgi:osmotically-inducible protein OsmY